ncbi:unnamed protein product [Protopolystoma xenopodis]|uniref:Uncharacterized protein n=1 Tax=Protopolystoma xenopodis TaxID=117903 RepID=A0A448XNF5_9PLAT|nr:unnamed protein product [Protopolystoma xenopodis]
METPIWCVLSCLLAWEEAWFYLNLKRLEPDDQRAQLMAYARLRETDVASVTTNTDCRSGRAKWRVLLPRLSSSASPSLHPPAHDDSCWALLGNPTSIRAYYASRVYSLRHLAVNLVERIIRVNVLSSVVEPKSPSCTAGRSDQTLNADLLTPISAQTCQSLPTNNPRELRLPAPIGSSDIYSEHLDRSCAALDASGKDALLPSTSPTSALHLLLCQLAWLQQDENTPLSFESTSSAQPFTKRAIIEGEELDKDDDSDDGGDGAEEDDIIDGTDGDKDPGFSVDDKTNRQKECKSSSLSTLSGHQKIRALETPQKATPKFSIKQSRASKRQVRARKRRFVRQRREGLLGYLLTGKLLPWLAMETR